MSKSRKSSNKISDRDSNRYASTRISRPISSTDITEMMTASAGDVVAALIFLNGVFEFITLSI
jgi:hypothetical protein